MIRFYHRNATGNAGLGSAYALICTDFVLFRQFLIVTYNSFSGSVLFNQNLGFVQRLLA